MTKRQSREPRHTRSRATEQDTLLPGFSLGETMPIRKPKELTPKNDNQARYLSLMGANTLTFGLGPAGTGKTFLASYKAGEWFDNRAIEKLIITRPIVEAGENLGFLPGELDEKIAPYFEPVREALQRRWGSGRLEYMLKAKQIEFVPLAFMRGRSFDNSAIILDEAQNTTPKQMKLFLTRVGEGSKLIVNGDLKQSDIPGPNGLRDAVDRLRGVSSVGTVVFTREDVVRSGMARAIVDAYEGEGAAPLPAFITQPVDKITVTQVLSVNDDIDTRAIHDSVLGQLPRERHRAIPA